MVSATCENVYEHIENKLLECGITIPNYLKDCLSILESPFSNLKTEYQQRKFYKNKLGLVVSIAYMYLYTLYTVHPQLSEH